MPQLKSHGYEGRRLRMLAAHATGTVLDVGCAAMPNPHLAPSDTTGLDLLPAPTDGPRYGAYIQGDAREAKQQLGDRRFDTVVAGEFIEHLEDPYAFLRDVRELLAPGGRLVLSTPNPLGFPVLALELIRNKSFFYTEDHTYYFLPRWVERLLEATGYTVEQIEPVGLWLPVGYVPWCPVALSYQVIYVARPAGA